MHLQVLIGDEPEQGMENLMEVEIPEDVEQKLKDADLKEQEELQKEEERMRQEEEEEKKKNSEAEGTDKKQEDGLVESCVGICIFVTQTWLSVKCS